MLNSFDVSFKGDIKTVFINEGTVIFKSIYNPLKKEHKFIYILAGLAKEKIISALSTEDLNKLIVNEEKDVLYGNVHYIILHYIILHYITLHYITLHYRSTFLMII